MQLNGNWKKGAFLTAAVTAAAAYSYLPSVAGKLRFRGKPTREDKVLYLTFDDGPSSEYTGELLDLLKKYEIRASFFVVAESAEENPDLIERMKREGHLIGLHSLNHVSAMLQTPAGTKRDFDESMAIMERIGVTAEYYRPPWGHVNLCTPGCLKKHGLRKVLWHVMAQDWEKNTTEELIQYKLLKRARAGSVICLHDGRGKDRAPKRMIDALDKTFPIWLEEGYRFQRIDERSGQ